MAAGGVGLVAPQRFRRGCAGSAGSEPWDSQFGETQHAVQGLTRIGIDGSTTRRCHRYSTLVVDHDTGRLLAAPSRDRKTLNAFFTEQGEKRCAAVTHVLAVTHVFATPRSRSLTRGDAAFFAVPRTGATQLLGTGLASPGDVRADWLRDERLGLVARLSDLSPPDGETPSLCQGWSVRHVVAHLVTPLAESLPDGDTGCESSRSFGAMDSVAHSIAGRPTQPMMALLEEHAACSGRRRPGRARTACSGRRRPGRARTACSGRRRPGRARTARPRCRRRSGRKQPARPRC
jgi:hypothetical protein